MLSVAGSWRSPTPKNGKWRTSAGKLSLQKRRAGDGDALVAEADTVLVRVWVGMTVRLGLRVAVRVGVAERVRVAVVVRVGVAVAVAVIVAVRVGVAEKVRVEDRVPCRARPAPALSLKAKSAFIFPPIFSMLLGFKNLFRRLDKLLQLVNRECAMCFANQHPWCGTFGTFLENQSQAWRMRFEAICWGECHPRHTFRGEVRKTLAGLLDAPQKEALEAPRTCSNDI